VGICVYIARCCAPFTLAHKTEVSTLSCGHDQKLNLEKKEHIELMATKKGGKKSAKKKGGSKKGGKKAAKKR